LSVAEFRGCDGRHDRASREELNRRQMSRSTAFMGVPVDVPVAL